MKKNAQYWIEKLKLTKHVEGGAFKETYRSPGVIAQRALPGGFTGNRAFSTAIYFLLKDQEFSSLHRIKQDEVWHFYTGDPLIIHVIDAEGNYSEIKLGNDLEQGQVFQAVVPAGAWFGASLLKSNSYTLVGCTVAPGFDFDDFELAQREHLIKLYPQHRTIIEKLTRG